ncbi:MAG: SLC13 family permease [Candidatus Dadabacteria bacterium]|nr:MAG: SLC13 family permease [Candidatus Dadabacteria bacterium]
MGIEAWITLAVVVAVMALLAFTRVAAYLVLLAGVVTLLTLRILSEQEMLEAMANPGMVTVGVLFAVVAGVRETGAMSWVAQPLLGRPRSVREAQLRTVAPVAFLSAFLNNTPLVAVMLPVLNDWARKCSISVSKLLIPLSYASILGGACSLIGTSTLLVVNGLIQAELGPEYGLSMFDITWVGLPCALVGLAYILLFADWLLPDRRPVISPQDDAREYVVEMVVEPGSALSGRTIEQAGLRHLPGLYLIEIEREGQVLPAVSPNVVLRDNDRLVFAGIVESVVDLQKIRGLKPATDQVFKLDAERTNRRLVEAVVSDRCPIVGMTIREGKFRTRYNAAVIAVARGGQRIRQKIGDIVLQPGDTLLLEARASFADQHRNSRDFFLVSRVANSAPIRHERAWVSLLILAAMVLAVSSGAMSMLNAAMLAAGAMILTRCTSASSALRSIDWQVLLVIAAAVAIGKAMETTGAARGVTEWLVGLAGTNPSVIMGVLCAATMLFTNVMNANAAAVLMFPIAVSTAAVLGAEGQPLSPMPFVIAVAMGAVASFATPIGYQTNLMVMGPGGYRFSDYVRLGLPLSVLVWLTSVLVIPRVWPFAG